ncbi:acyltransferase family protein [Streptomyces boninensis]|uniref:acyltransferase family protein n=1 Tax=Streptomyces boninensis TaxID=2039455 RepID=UPI003B226FB1
MTVDRTAQGNPPGAPRGWYTLDGYRAVAALTVLTFHAYQHQREPGTWRWPLQGTIGHEILLNTDMLVDMFFILSGFLLGLPFARAALGTGKPRAARIFLIRRAVRLLPPYWIVVLVVWSISNPVIPGDWRDLVLHLTLTHVWSDDKIFYTDGPAWTLGVEAHFYVLLAVLGVLAQRGCRRLATRRARIGLLLGGVGALMVLSLAFKTWAVFVRDYPEESWSMWFGPPAKLDVFATGMLLAVAAAAGLRWPNRVVRTLVGLCGAGVIAGGIWCRTLHVPEPYLHSVFGLGITLVVGATALSLDAGPRWLSWAPMVSLSTVSYSIYLWHEPILRAIAGRGVLPEPGTWWAWPLTAVILLAVSVPLSYLSYHVIEATALQIMGAFDSRGRPREYHTPLPPPELKPGKPG